MASTLLAGLVEKFGYTNIPLRKLGLHRYLMGEVDINCGLMQERLEESMGEHSKPGLYGGVSVIDRNSAIAKPLTDIERVRDDIKAFKAEHFARIDDLYFRATEIYCKSVVYKNMNTNPLWRIELTTDIHKYDPLKIQDAYERHFEHVKAIHLHRPFRGWINSLASQAFTHPNFKSRIKFFPHLKARELELYERQIARIPGIHLQFDEMFSKPIEKLAQEVATYLELPALDINFREQAYDLYGKEKKYDIAFNKFDDRKVFLKPKTLDRLEAYYREGRLEQPTEALFSWWMYLLDMIAWRLAN